MKILFLGPSTSPLIEFIRESGDEVISSDEKLDLPRLAQLKPELIVSYGYRHIIKSDIIDTMRERTINLHISLLPWNRGADPNFWSFVEDTPKGVTIHYIDAGIDTGAIIVQKAVTFQGHHTLKSSYDFLQTEIIQLFKDHWQDIKNKRCKATPQSGKGSFHRSVDKLKLGFLTEKLGYHTPVTQLERFGAENALSLQFWNSIVSQN